MSLSWGIRPAAEMIHDEHAKLKEVQTPVEGRRLPRPQHHAFHGVETGESDDDDDDACLMVNTVVVVVVVVVVDTADAADDSNYKAREKDMVDAGQDCIQTVGTADERSWAPGRSSGVREAVLVVPVAAVEDEAAVWTRTVQAAVHSRLTVVVVVDAERHAVASVDAAMVFSEMPMTTAVATSQTGATWTAAHSGRYISPCLRVRRVDRLESLRHFGVALFPRRRRPRHFRTTSV